MAKANRQKLQLHHTFGSVSYACSKHDLVMYIYFINSVISVFMPKLSTHRMHDPGSIVPHIRPKLFIDNQMS
jgi:hypothetical protein